MREREMVFRLGNIPSDSIPSKLGCLEVVDLSAKLIYCGYQFRAPSDKVLITD